MTDQESWRNPASNQFKKRSVEQRMAEEAAKNHSWPSEPPLTSKSENSAEEPATQTAPESKRGPFSAFTKILTILTGTR